MMNEVKTNVILIENVRDIDLKHVFECGQCFRWNDEFNDGSYIGIVDGKVCRARLIRTPEGTCNLELEASGGDEGFWRNYFDIDTDYGIIKDILASRDSRTIPAIEACGGIRILNQDFFETLISFIISQNNNIPRIKKCIEAISEKFGEPIGSFAGRERYAFPQATKMASLAESDFAELKFGYRSAYMPSAAVRYLQDGVPAGSDQEMRDELLGYLGIGPKVANCIMLFGLRAVAVFPIDTWVKKIMADIYGFAENDLKGMASFAEANFGELSGYAQQYLFYYCRG